MELIELTPEEFEEVAFVATAAELAAIGLTKVYAAGATYAEARGRLVAALAFKPGHREFGIELGMEIVEGREFAFIVEGLRGCRCHGFHRRFEHREPIAFVV